MINELSVVDALSGADNFPLYDASNGDARRVSLSTLLAYMQANITPVGSLETQYSAPSATGFSVTILPSTAGGSVHLILTPVAGYAAGTIVLPLSTGLVDKQEVMVNCTQSVASLTVSGNGAGAVTGAPTSLAANGFFRMKYDAALSSWYRVG
jgi:hypothetical protein